MIDMILIYLHPICACEYWMQAQMFGIEESKGKGEDEESRI